MSKIETSKRIGFTSKSEGLFNFQDYKKAKYKMVYVIMFLFLLTLSLICLLPVLWVMLSGFKSMEEMYAIPPTFFPQSIDFSKIIRVWSSISIGRYFFNTIMLIIGCLVCDIVVNGLCGYVLSRIKPAGSKIIDTLIFWSMMLPGISMVPLYMTFVDIPLLHINLVGTYFPVWVMAGCSAFNVLLFRNFFNGIHMSYIEAAKLDGCNVWEVFLRIILPLSKPIIMVISIFSITGTWGNFMWPYLVLKKEAMQPVAVMLFNMQSQLSVDRYMVVMMLSIIPPLVIFFCFSKQIMGGMTLGGVKG